MPSAQPGGLRADSRLRRLPVKHITLAISGSLILPGEIGQGHMNGRLVYLSILLFVLTPSFATADSGGTLVVMYFLPADGAISGDPLPGVTVRLSTAFDMKSGRYGVQEAITDLHGRAVFSGLPPDNYWFEVSLEGLRRRKWLVDIHSQVTRHVSVRGEFSYPECSLFEFWDFRGQLDPGFPGTMTLFSLR